MFKRLNFNSELKIVQSTYFFPFVISNIRKTIENIYKKRLGNIKPKTSPPPQKNHKATGGKLVYNLIFSKFFN